MGSRSPKYPFSPGEQPPPPPQDAPPPPRIIEQEWHPAPEDAPAFPSWLRDRDPFVDVEERNHLFRLFLHRRRTHSVSRFRLGSILTAGRVSLTLLAIMASIALCFSVSCFCILLPLVLIPLIQNTGSRTRRTQASMPSSVSELCSPNGVLINAAQDIYLSGEMRGGEVLQAFYLERRWPIFWLYTVTYVLLMVPVSVLICLHTAEQLRDPGMYLYLAFLLWFLYQLYWALYLVTSRLHLDLLAQRVRVWRGERVIFAGFSCVVACAAAAVCYQLFLCFAYFGTTGGGFSLLGCLLWGSLGYWLRDRFDDLLGRVKSDGNALFRDADVAFQRFMAEQVLRDPDEVRYQETPSMGPADIARHTGARRA